MFRMQASTLYHTSLYKATKPPILLVSTPLLLPRSYIESNNDNLLCRSACRHPLVDGLGIRLEGSPVLRDPAQTSDEIEMGSNRTFFTSGYSQKEISEVSSTHTDEWSSLSATPWPELSEDFLPTNSDPASMLSSSSGACLRSHNKDSIVKCGSPIATSFFDEYDALYRWKDGEADFTQTKLTADDRLFYQQMDHTQFASELLGFQDAILPCARNAYQFPRRDAFRDADVRFLSTVSQNVFDSPNQRLLVKQESPLSTKMPPAPRQRKTNDRSIYKIKDCDAPLDLIISQKSPLAPYDSNPQPVSLDDTASTASAAEIRPTVIYTPVLDAHRGIDISELASRAAKYQMKNSSNVYDRKWLLSFAGKLSIQGELLDEYRCYVVGCNQRAKRGDHIATHVGAHLDIRPFQCPHCSARFQRKNECCRHVSAIHDSSRSFICAICSKSFNRRDLLKRHGDRVHKRPAVNDTFISSKRRKVT